MNRQQMQSSNLKSAGWEDGVLEVEFVDGSTWKYQGVPEMVFRQMLAAPSVGRFFRQAIQGRFEGAQS